MNPSLRALGLLALGLVVGLAPLSAAEQTAPKEFFVYFGTYTKAKSKGIYRARLEVATGRLSPAELVAETRDPSFVAVNPKGTHLYTIDEGSDPVRTPGRGVKAYAIDARTGALTFLNEQSPGGPGPCHLIVDHTGRCVLVANYSGGSVAALPVAADGRLGPAKSVIQHTGSSVNAARQKAPHAHAIMVSPDNRFALSPDLGIDRVLVYRLDAANASLAPHSPAFAAVAPGSGPRHLAFHPGGRFAYVINEMLCTMTAFGYDAAKGELKELQTLSTLPPGVSVQKGYSTAEVMAHPGGAFLYGSNRGHDSIAVYAIDASTGRLSYVAHQPTQGRTPRHFAIDPTGAWLLAENQDSDTVAVFGIDAKTGRLTPTGQLLDVPAPVSASFVRVK